MQVVLDAVLVLLILGALYSGWRQGAFAAILSAVGVIAGLIVGLSVAPWALSAMSSQLVRIVTLVALIVLLVGLGHGVGSAAGSQLRRTVQARWLQFADSAVGALFNALAAVLVFWFIATPLAASFPGQVGASLRESKVLAAIDVAVPPVFSQVPARLALLLDETGLPPLVSPFGTARGAHVDAPNPAAVSPEMVDRVRPAVVHVMGDSGLCQRRLMGSGFVIEANYVLTNAHVVAGTDRVSLDTVVGVKDAEVVFYDPDVDIAVLRADNLGIAPLRWSERELGVGDDAVVMGYPQSGPFEAAAARIRGRLNISGPDIYVAGRVERQAYTVRGSIRQGNSGGPLLDTRGAVVGMIFGASIDSTETGYALTAEQVRQRVGDVRRLRGSVDTQTCVGATAGAAA